MENPRAAAGAVGPLPGAPAGWVRGIRVPHLSRASRADIAWVVFIGLNLIAMRLIPAWQTVPFLIIWVSLTVMYGFRLWRLGSTVLTVTLVTVATGGLIGWQVLRGQQDAEYLVEVPLLAIMFVAMVWHARRRQAALVEMKRVSEHNLRLLDQQRQFLQDASHELGTPITIALGHAELIERTAPDQATASDARVAVDELQRMRRLANRLLLLASTDTPGFLRLAPVDVAEFLAETLRRWSQTPRRWSLGDLAEAVVDADQDRLTVAIDALIENAVRHTSPGGRIELAARVNDGTCHPGRDRFRDRHPGLRDWPDLRPVHPGRRGPQPSERRLRPRPGGGQGDRRSPRRLSSASAAQWATDRCSSFFCLPQRPGPPHDGRTAGSWPGPTHPRHFHDHGGFRDRRMT